MPTVNKNMLVPYTPEQMYELVNDIESYPEFVPNCGSSKVILRTSDEVRASLTLSRGGISKSFATLNRLHPHKMIEMRLLEGPFRQLEGFWRFEEMNQQCRVSLDLEFEFNSKMLGMMFGPFFHQAVVKLVEAFDIRAKQVYGEQ